MPFSSRISEDKSKFALVYYSIKYYKSLFVLYDYDSS